MRCGTWTESPISKAIIVYASAISYTELVRALRAIAGFWFGDDRGQDLADYCLLTALVALIGLAVFVHLSGGIQNLWNIGNSTLVSGKSVAGGSNGGANTTSDKVR